ncbi:MAG: hypothetical protein NTV19_12980 [Burkholderiales bacterium]|nr:hypothetical protein [Burkholderiales bacterium]
MKIVALPLSGDRALAPTQPGSVQAALWRRSLELAQWQARQRIAAQVPTNDAGPDPSMTPPDDPARPAHAGHPIEAGDRSFAAAPDAGARQPARVEALARALAQAAAGAPAALTSPPAPLPVPGAPLALALTDAPGPEPVLLASRPVCCDLSSWPEVMVHASLQGNRLSVGMRDASIGQDDARQLLHRLRALLREAGLVLGHLTINGWQLGAGDDAALPAN